MIEFFVLRGHDWDKVSSAPPLVKAYLSAFMADYYDDKAAEYRALAGGDA